MIGYRKLAIVRFRLIGFSETKEEKVKSTLESTLVLLLVMVIGLTVGSEVFGQETGHAVQTKSTVWLMPSEYSIDLYYELARTNEGYAISFPDIEFNIQTIYLGTYYYEVRGIFNTRIERFDVRTLSPERRWLNFVPEEDVHNPIQHFARWYELVDQNTKTVLVDIARDKYVCIEMTNETWFVFYFYGELYPFPWDGLLNCKIHDGLI